MPPMCGSIARQPTRPVESSRPQRLAANTENGRQLRMCRGAWIAVSEREKSAHQDVPGRGPAGEFLRCVRARAQLQERGMIPRDARIDDKAGAVQAGSYLLGSVRQRDRDGR